MIKKIFLSIFIYFLSVHICMAGMLSSDRADIMFNQDVAFHDEVSDVQAEATLTETIGVMIQVFLGILGIIFLALVIYAGYNWMTARGNEEKITKAKSTLITSIIGLVIIVSAYVITYFVFRNIPG